MSKPANIIMPVVLFVLLCPGVLLSVPGAGWTPGYADMKVVATHAAVFAAAWVGLRIVFAKYY